MRLAQFYARRVAALQTPVKEAMAEISVASRRASEEVKLQ
jgi:hypothetical protein